jgi:hypothetical protein
MNNYEEQIQQSGYYGQHFDDRESVYDDMERGFLFFF